MLVSEKISNQEVVSVIKQAAGRFLSDVAIFDVYQGKNIDLGFKSIAYSLTFTNPEATLTDEEVNKAMEKVTKALTENFSAIIR